MLLAAVLAMHLTTTTFTPNSTVPLAMVARDCGGKNISPALAWSGAPPRTKSFALIVHDPDAPRPGGFDHWVLYDLPATATHVETGAQLDARETGRNGTGATGYYGPCPPPGKTHHYLFTLYALDIAGVGAASPLDAQALRDRVRGHVLSEATLTGLYATSPP
jgi:hypothetical protein